MTVSLCAGCGLPTASNSHCFVRLFHSTPVSSIRPPSNFRTCVRFATALLDARSNLAVAVAPLPDNLSRAPPMSADGRHKRRAVSMPCAVQVDTRVVNCSYVIYCFWSCSKTSQEGECPWHSDHHRTYCL